jgi:cytochrome c oxidase assembly protein subunit 15
MSSVSEITSYRVPSPRASVASWLGVLFVVVLLVVSVGGYVRLSGSGLSIPGWPVIKVDDSHWTLLPPLNDEDWMKLKSHFEDDQQRLRMEVARGAVGISSLGKIPEDLSSFKTMFMIEWSHRFVAAIAGLIAAGCLAVILRRRELRDRVGALFAATCAFILLQAVIGGMLVRSGTATHWLFVHLGIAAAILGLIAWSILSLVSMGDAKLDPAIKKARRPLTIAAGVALAISWLQLMFGALVAGSRGDDSVASGTNHFSSEWPLIAGRWMPDLWIDQRSAAWNLLDNALLHQWLHRWFAGAVALSMVVMFFAAWRRPLGPRLRLCLKVSASFLVAQITLGLANIFLTHPVLVSLSHLVMGMFMLVSLVLISFDARHELPQGEGATA